MIIEKANLDEIVLQLSQGDSYWVLGDLYTFKAVSEETDGKYALLELVIQPQNSAPSHIHSREAEAFFIEEGEVEFQLDDRTILATPEPSCILRRVKFISLPTSAPSPPKCSVGQRLRALKNSLPRLERR
jgi:hypothetical protein